MLKLKQGREPVQSRWGPVRQAFNGMTVTCNSQSVSRITAISRLSAGDDSSAVHLVRDIIHDVLNTIGDVADLENDVPRGNR